MKAPLIYKEKPVFGFDIGHSTIKVVQLTQEQDKPSVQGYGYVNFGSNAIDENGVINEPITIAKSLQNLFKELTVGSITTNRVSVSVPVSQSYTRIVTLPKISREDLDQAVQLEAEQYIPVPTDELYLDYEIATSTITKNKDDIEVLMVACPQKLIDSYVHLLHGVGLEIHNLETNIIAIARAVKNRYQTDESTLIMDFGAKSSDLAIDDETIRITGTISVGGDTLTELLTRKFDINFRQAHSMKARYGIAESKFQKKIISTLEPALSELVRETKRMLRYYNERTVEDRNIKRVSILGGGANLPGLDEFLEDKLGIEVSVCNPWETLNIGNIQSPHSVETTLYTTAIGLALQEIERQ